VGNKLYSEAIAFFNEEDSLDGVKKVIWRNKEYDVGNRRHDKVELWKDNKYIRLVSMNSVKKVEVE